MTNVDELAQVFFRAAMRRAKEIDPDVGDANWDDDTPEAHSGREAFRSGVEAIIVELAELRGCAAGELLGRDKGRVGARLNHD